MGQGRTAWLRITRSGERRIEHKGGGGGNLTDAVRKLKSEVEAADGQQGCQTRGGGRRQKRPGGMGERAGVLIGAGKAGTRMGTHAGETLPASPSWAVRIGG